MIKVTRNILSDCLGKDCTKCIGIRDCEKKQYDIQTTTSTAKNSNRLVNSEELAMEVAKLTSLLSRDPNTKVGACIIDEKGKIVGTGCNHMPSDSELYPWDRNKKNVYENKYPYIVHAEMDALISANGKGKAIFVTHFPCSNCAKHIAAAGIKKVIYMEYIPNSQEDIEISKNIFCIEGINVYKFSDLSNISDIEINMEV